MTTTQNQHHDMTFTDLLLILWDARKTMLTGTIICLIGAALLLTTATKYYKASLTVSPANNMNGTQLSSLLSNDKLYAIRHMIAGNGNSTADYDSFEQILQGQDLARALLQNQKLIAGIKKDQQTSLINKILGTSPLTPANFSDYLAQKVKIQPVTGTSFRRISYTHPDPNFASYFLKTLHIVADTKLRTKTNENAALRITYLKEAINNTINPEHRRALTTLLLEQERLKMISSINQAYAAQIIEPAATQAKPAWPRPTLIVTIAIFLGSLGGLIIHNLRNIKPQSQSTPSEKPAVTTKSRSFKNWLYQERSSANQSSTPQTDRLSSKDAAE